MVERFEKIIIESHFDKQVMKIILNSPKGNILDGQMMEEILVAIKEAGKNKDLKLLVFEGAGKHFSFGASVEEHKKEKASFMLERFHGIFYSLIELGVPLAALVRGQCLGGAMEIVSYCDFIFAETSAVFGQPEIKLGVLPPPASVILPLKIGQKSADWMILTGNSISAGEAFELGLVTAIIPEGKDGWEYVTNWVKENIIDKSASSLKCARECARMHFHKMIKEFLPQIQDVYLNKLMQTFDANEGIASFLEKRKPVFKNE